MSSFNPAGHPRLRTALDDANQRRYQGWLAAVYSVILATLLFNLALAFVNTNVFSVSESYVILSEMVLLSLALFLALSRSATLYIILILYLGYMAFIMALRPELDLKAVRDMLIPIIFYCLGSQIRRIEDADKLIWISSIVVLAIGFFEFFFISIYTEIVDIFEYYVARGTLEADENFNSGSNLFVSSTRVGGRNFFGFLGELRASSVFLEPVTMGNFGAFLCLWALFRSGMKRRWLMFLAAFVAIILSDARFGMMVCLAFFPVAILYRFVPRLVWWSVPFLFMLGLALYGGWTREVYWSDDLLGRILHSAQLMMKLTPASIFGVSDDVPFVADNGFAYTLTQIGLIGTLGLWTLYMYAPSNNAKALQFKALAVTFICLNMTISNSFYSIKLAALFWLAAGVADALSPKKSDQSLPNSRDFQKYRNGADIDERPTAPRHVHKARCNAQQQLTNRKRMMRAQRFP
ncbi:MAG: UDP-phosphate alpha N-acetylglucosaminyltransferase [Roseibium sp.]